MRVFGKPEAFAHRRMGVALATGDTVALAREKAVTAAGSITVIKVD